MQLSTTSANPAVSEQPKTRLARFVAAENLSTSRLSRAADVNASYLFALKAGASEPTRPVMEKVRCAAAELLGRDVSVTELFDFGC